MERWGTSPVAWGSVPYVSLPPPPALPPPALLPPIEPNNWRVRKDGVGLVEKRPRAHDSGSEDKCTKVRVTEIQPSGHQNENEYFYLSFVLFLTVLPALVAPGGPIINCFRFTTFLFPSAHYVWGTRARRMWMRACTSGRTRPHPPPLL